MFPFRNISFTPSGHSGGLGRCLKVIAPQLYLFHCFVSLNYCYLNYIYIFSSFFFLDGFVALLCHFFSIPLLFTLPLTCTDILFCFLPALVKLSLSAVQDNRAKKSLLKHNRIENAICLDLLLENALPIHIIVVLQTHVILA